MRPSRSALDWARWLQDMVSIFARVALQFSMAPDVAAALVVGCANPQQVLADYTSLNTRIPQAFWLDLRSEGLIENDAAVPAEM